MVVETSIFLSVTQLYTMFSFLLNTLVKYILLYIEQRDGKRNLQTKSIILIWKPENGVVGKETRTRIHTVTMIWCTILFFDESVLYVAYKNKTNWEMTSFHA